MEWLSENIVAILAILAPVACGFIAWLCKLIINLTIKATQVVIAVDAGVASADALTEQLEKTSEDFKAELRIIHGRIDDLSNRHVDHENRIGHLEGGRDSREHNTHGGGN